MLFQYWINRLKLRTGVDNVIAIFKSRVVRYQYSSSNIILLCQGDPQPGPPRAGKPDKPDGCCRPTEECCGEKCDLQQQQQPPAVSCRQWKKQQCAGAGRAGQ